MAIELEDRGRALENEYFRRREQELIEKMRAKLADESARATAMQCPRCEGKLVETDYENIKIDICDKCSGVWLDVDELTHIVEKEEKSGGWFDGIFK
jgi:uncharacterized protein with PIN domain